MKTILPVLSVVHLKTCLQHIFYWQGSFFLKDFLFYINFTFLSSFILYTSFLIGFIGGQATSQHAAGE